MPLLKSDAGMDGGELGRVGKPLGQGRGMRKYCPESSLCRRLTHLGWVRSTQHSGTTRTSAMAVRRNGLVEVMERLFGFNLAPSNRGFTFTEGRSGYAQARRACSAQENQTRKGIIDETPTWVLAKQKAGHCF